MSSRDPEAKTIVVGVFPAMHNVEFTTGIIQGQTVPSEETTENEGGNGVHCFHSDLLHGTVVQRKSTVRG